MLEWVEIAGPGGYERRQPRGARLRLPQLGAARGRGRRRRRPGAAPAARGAGQGHPAGAAPAPPRGPAAGDQDVRVDLQESRRPRRRRAHRRDAAGAGRLCRPGGRRRPLRAQARELHREHRRGVDRRRRGADGRGASAACTRASAWSSSPRCTRSERCGSRGGASRPRRGRGWARGVERPWRGPLAAGTPADRTPVAPSPAPAPPAARAAHAAGAAAGAWPSRARARPAPRADRAAVRAGGDPAADGGLAVVSQVRARSRREGAHQRRARGRRATPSKRRCARPRTA